MTDAAHQAFGGRAALKLELETFEGPLDLLLHLIRKHELDILDIPIALITREYLAYLEAMKELHLDVAGEYLVMAATLMHLKSVTLLPKREALDEEGEAWVEDPREALVRRLLEYQRYREAARELSDRDLEGRDVFRRPSRADLYRAAVAPELVPLDLYALLSAFRTLVESRPAAAVHEVQQERLSIQEMIGHISDHLRTHPRTTLAQLVRAETGTLTRERIVVTFLAILEMAKLRLIRVFQARITGDDLIIERALIEGDPTLPLAFGQEIPDE